MIALLIQLGVAFLHGALHLDDDGFIKLWWDAALLLPLADSGGAVHAGGYVVAAFLSEKFLPIVFAFFVAVTDVAGEHSIGDVVAVHGAVCVQMINVGLSVIFAERLTAIGALGIEMSPQTCNFGWLGSLSTSRQSVLRM